MNILKIDGDDCHNLITLFYACDENTESMITECVLKTCRFIKYMLLLNYMLLFFIR